ncbi:RNA helicase [Coprinopsis cinerea okayama7|uniref:RNA helicase n=1 Tax=Coprinopsis cinerea (strain Okayama-7 / 130 / ATCC MYA-4618 / FGSC 9003) TaxID=240176 RepID=A8P5F1_COPC7|nr:RNA helicase [Coprinopsis cinerea okayama7\|eukprot:XP_001838927.2 RNA helicase [Coprinopsis cinerea okayama7\
MKEAQGRAAGQNTGAAADPQAVRRCDRCPRTVPERWWMSHQEYHARQDKRTAYQAAMEQAENDKEGIVVTGKDGIDFGVLDADSAVEVTVTIENTTAEYAFSVKACRMRSSTRGDEHGKMFSARLKGKSKGIRAGSSRTLSIVFHPGYAGKYEDTLELLFWHLDLRRSFVITRRVTATVGDQEDHELLRAKAPYTGPKETPRFRPDGTKIIPSLRPPTWTKTNWTDRLPEYKVPQKIIDVAFNPKIRNQNAIRNNYYCTWRKNGQGKFSPFISKYDRLTIEYRQDLDRYALEDVEIKPNYPRYELKVPGLAENRPSVLVGDFILVSESNPAIAFENRTWYEGRVHEVRMDEVVLRFGDGFNTYRGNRFDVRFVLNRLPYRRMHHALVNSFAPRRILFPGPQDILGLKRVTAQQKAAIVPYYRQLKDDDEQLETVTAILHQNPGSAPFIVFGPPGTGKTVTIIEAMKQLLDKDPNVRILACAPSNSAADLLAQKLADRGPKVVFRLNSLTRKVSDLPKNLKEFSRINENTVFAVPPVEELLQYRVVVATCLSGGVPASLGVKRGHYSHIFIDEAGQGKEPEVIFPIKSLAGPKTNIILAGDNQQLGPIVQCNIAAGLGLKTSYLARLMDRDVYNLDNGGRGITIVKLVKNFRSHPAILEFSNDHFYSSELQPCGDRAMICSLETFEELPKKRFPLIFHGIVGKDQREASSPSFFNVEEASQVKKYCKALLDNRKLRLTAEHIGIITPYHAQRCKILDLLHKEVKMRDIKVGSVEEFQGQERRIIIMSTVRSNTEYVSSDITRSLGFVANSRRMNVAITRAQALLVVIGNPIVLSLDPLWRSFLGFIHTRGGWRGKQIDWNPVDLESSLAGTSFEARRRTEAEREMEETIQRLKALIVQRHEDSDVELDLEDSDDEEGEYATAFERPILREAE